MIRVVVIVLFALSFDAAIAQTRDLHTDLKDLNVRHTTAHYLLAGTVSDATLQHYGQALELAHKEYAKGFDELLDERNAGARKATVERFNVVILAKAAEYRELTGAYFGEAAEHSTGMFVPAEKLLIIRDSRNREQTYGTLFHEAFHQFARRHIPAMPTWIDEGLATYYGTARPVRGGLRFNRPHSGYIHAVRMAAKRGKLIPLRALMASTQSAFYDQSPVEGLTMSHKMLCYAQSYTLVSYMVNDPDGRAHLRTYLRRLSEVEKSEDARRVTGEMFSDELLEAIVNPWLAHVDR